MKKIISVLACLALLISCFSFGVSATEAKTVEYLEDGSYIVTEFQCSNPNARTATNGAKVSTYYTSSNKAVFSVTLTGYFTYTKGVSAKATSANVVVSIYDDTAEYISKSSSTSGATAYGAGTVSYLGYAKTLSLQITCDVNGNLS